MAANGNDIDACRATALRLLARREHSAAELRRKLGGRGFDTDIVERIITDLVQQRLASDDRFAEAYVRARATRGYGPARLRLDLRQRGVDATLVEHSVKAGEWQEAAAVRSKRFGPTLPSDPRERARQMRFLQYRGFTTEQIRRALNADDGE